MGTFGHEVIMSWCEHDVPFSVMLLAIIAAVGLSYLGICLEWQISYLSQGGSANCLILTKYQVFTSVRDEISMSVFGRI